MTPRVQAAAVLRRRNRRSDKRQRMLAKMAAWRAAKARKRLERIAAGWTPEPKMVRFYPLDLGVRDNRTGEVAWVTLKSVRDAAKRLSVLLKHYS